MVLRRAEDFREGSRGPLAAGVAVGLAMLLALLIVALPAHAAFWDDDATPLWTNVADGPGSGDDNGVDVEITSGGVTYVAGSVLNAGVDYDISLGKYLYGTDAWGGLKTYNGPAKGDDRAKAMALGPGGVVYVTGFSTNASGNTDVVLVKWSGKTGKRLWVRRYDGPAHSADEGVAVGVDRKGNVTVAGSSRSGNGRDVFVRSWSAAGKVRWSWRYDGVAHGDDWANDLHVARDGSVYVNASIKGAGDVMTSLTTRRSSSGKKKWLDLYVHPDTSACVMKAMTARPGGGVYVGGYQVTTFENDGLALGYAASGARVYIASDGGVGDQAFNDIAVTSAGEVVTAGYTVSGGDYQPRYVRFNAEGTPAGSGTISTSGSDEYVAVATDAFGGYYVTGTNTDGVGRQRIETRRLTGVSNGGMWLSRMNPYLTNVNQSSAIAVRGGTAVVAGTVDTGSAAGDDQVLFTYVY